MMRIWKVRWNTILQVIAISNENENARTIPGIIFKNVTRQIYLWPAPSSPSTYHYTAKDVPQPQVVLALGFLNVKPRLLSPPCQSICMPKR